MSDSSFLQYFNKDYNHAIGKILSNEVISNPDKVKELMACFFSKEIRICQRASWVVSKVVDTSPLIIYPYLEKMVANLSNPMHDAVVRNTFRVLQYIDIPEEFEGRVYDISIEYLLDLKQAIAIRVFAMTTAANIVMIHPELVNELSIIIEEHLPHGSSGFRARGKKILKQIRKIQK
ncbi:MAG: hypothetical protein V3V14_03520 [Saprospiraceae bacterium]